MGISALAAPVIGLAGGLISGGKAADASKRQAEALRAAADKASAMAQFNPYGMTTNFGTSTFADGRGGYQLSPQLQAIQNRLFGSIGSAPQRTTTQIPQVPQGYSLTDPNPMSIRAAVMPKDGFTFAYGPSGDRIEVPAVSQTTESVSGGYSPEEFMQQVAPLSGGAQSLFNLGQQYLATSPEQAAQDYMASQQRLLAPSREAGLSRVQTANFGRGTGGLGVQTGTGSAPSNPLAQAYFNQLGQQDLQLAAQADEAGMARARFGAGLFGTGGELLGQVPRLTTAGYGPLEAQLGLLGTTERLGQQPFMLSQDLANRYAQAGANAGNLYMQPQAAAASAYNQYQSYSPIGSALSGIGSGISPGGSAGSWFSGLFGSGGGRGFTDVGGQGAAANRALAQFM
jgi:hypothetical protein